MAPFLPLYLQMKLPSSVGQKKIKALDQMLSELGVGEFKKKKKKKGARRGRGAREQNASRELFCSPNGLCVLLSTNTESLQIAVHTVLE